MARHSLWGFSMAICAPQPWVTPGPMFTSASLPSVQGLEVTDGVLYGAMLGDRHAAACRHLFFFPFFLMLHSFPQIQCSHKSACETTIFAPQNPPPWRERCNFRAFLLLYLVGITKLKCEGIQNSTNFQFIYFFLAEK